MALTYPYALTSFVDLAQFAVQVQTFHLPDARRSLVTAGGGLIDYGRGARLWNGTVTITPLVHDDALALEARFSPLLEPGASFLIYDGRRKYPINDPTGAAVTGATVTLATVSSDGKDVTFSGLPITLSQGDAFGFTYGSSPVRYGYHRVTRRNGSTYEVTPPIRSGYEIGAAVTLAKPVIKAKVVPETVTPTQGNAGRVSTGLRFDFTQTLR
jgi:hypothetical protein